jgi:hypothetical protein
LIRERLELRELISWTPSEAQQTERLRNAPTSLDELNARFAKEQATLAADPDARAIYEERQAVHEAIGELGSLKELKASWTDALQRNDTTLTMPLLDKALKKQGIAMSPNSLALLKLRRAAMEAGLAVLEESAPTMPAQTDERADPNVRLKPSPGFSEHVEAFFAEKCRNTEEKKGYTAQTEKQRRCVLPCDSIDSAQRRRAASRIVSLGAIWGAVAALEEPAPSRARAGPHGRRSDR